LVGGEKKKKKKKKKQGGGGGGNGKGKSRTGGSRCNDPSTIQAGWVTVRGFRKEDYGKARKHIGNRPTESDHHGMRTKKGIRKWNQGLRGGT